ncbi:uncharacterized protein LOC124812268 [Hydra vulgaris]|uniref:Uncharacterized protein LOC124812268 n=1 Tax=Hydra vulgaris TaxID=6087 RepID=A0ABM4BD83_HYDVU
MEREREKKRNFKFRLKNTNIVQPLTKLNHKTEETTSHAKENWSVLSNTIRITTNLVKKCDFTNRRTNKELFTIDIRGVHHLCLLNDQDDTNKSQSSKSSIGDINKNNSLIKYFCNLAKKNDKEKLVDFKHLSQLLHSGVDINATDKHGQSAMHEVARVWHTDVAKFLLIHGATIDKPDNFGRTPLHVASAVDFPEMVSFLIENGADINSKTYGEQQTAIYYAAKNGAVESLKVLLEHGANIEDKDYKQRTPLQIAAELDRSVTAKLLIDNGADASVYDSSMMTAMVLLIQKMPSVALVALDQFHHINRATRREYFYVNCLVPPIKDSNCFAKSPLEVAVETNQYNLVLHPVMMELIKTKWNETSKLSALKVITINFVNCIMWTTLICTKPTDNRKIYAGSRKYWGPALESMVIVILIISIVTEIIDFVKSSERTKRYKQWRSHEIRKDLEYCHARWPDEQAYLKREIEELKNYRLVYLKDYWRIFDSFTLLLMGSVVILNICDIMYHSKLTNKIFKAVASTTMICMWLRLLKYARPFQTLGLFVVMIGHVVRDTLKIIFLGAHIFIPYIASFWINFGIVETEGYTMNGLELIWNIFQMSIIADWNFDKLVEKDKVMAEILCSTYLFFAGLVCLNLFIALMSNTFQRVYDNAVANALMQKAAYIVKKELRFSHKMQLRHYEWINSHCAPKILYYDDSEVNPSNNELTNKTQEIDEKLDKLSDAIESREKKFQNIIKDNNQTSVDNDASVEINEIKSLQKIVYELKEEFYKSMMQTRIEIAGLGLMIKDLIEIQEPIDQKSKTKNKKLMKKSKVPKNTNVLKTSEENLRDKIIQSSSSENHNKNQLTENPVQINVCLNEKNKKQLLKGAYPSDCQEMYHPPPILQAKHQLYEMHSQELQDHKKDLILSDEFFEGYAFQDTEQKQRAFIQSKWKKIFSNVISSKNKDNFVHLENEKPYTESFLPQLKTSNKSLREDNTKQ